MLPGCIHHINGFTALHREEAQNHGGPFSPVAFRVLRVLSKVNLPKFTRNDIPLFLGITGDLFPEAGWQAPERPYHGMTLDIP